MIDTIDFFSITAEQTSWSTSQELLTRIRHQVFVDEQHVPEELEVDTADPDALHWIAWATGDVAVGTARLVNNKIGRMAVLKEFRNQGAGSTLLRAIIKHALNERFTSLVLDAQKEAVPFYEDNGFQ